MDWASMPLAIAAASISPGVAGSWTVRSVSVFFVGMAHLPEFFSAALLAEIARRRRLDSNGARQVVAHRAPMDILLTAQADEQRLGIKTVRFHRLRCGDLPQQTQDVVGLFFSQHTNPPVGLRVRGVCRTSIRWTSRLGITRCGNWLLPLPAPRPG